MLEPTIIYKGTRLALEMNWQKVKIESDSQILINHIRGVNYHWRIATLVANTLSLTMATGEKLEGHSEVKQ